MCRHGRNNAYGLTLIELMITLALSSVLITAIYQTFHVQQRSYLVQDEIAKIQQGLRAGLYLMSREIRSAGYDPSRATAAGFVTRFSSPNDTFVINYTTDRNIIAFIMDSNGNGVIERDDTDNNGDGQVDIRDAEQVAYRLNSTNQTLERFSSTSGGGVWEPVIAHIDAVDFVYADSNGNVTTNPAQFAFVEIALLVRAEAQTSTYIDTATYLNQRGTNICPTCLHDHYHRRLLHTTVQVRNIGL